MRLQLKYTFTVFRGEGEEIFKFIFTSPAQGETRGPGVVNQNFSMRGPLLTMD